MPRYPKLSVSDNLFKTTSITVNPVLDFLLPSFTRRLHCTAGTRKENPKACGHYARTEPLFFSALSYASLCSAHQHRVNTTASISVKRERRARFGTTPRVKVVETKESEESKEDAEPVQLFRDAGHLKEPDCARTRRRSFVFNEQDFAAATRLPDSFFKDVEKIRNLIPPTQPQDRSSKEERQKRRSTGTEVNPGVEEQIRLLRSIRELEDKLATTKKKLDLTLNHETRHPVLVDEATPQEFRPPVTLSKEDYMNLVDLYFYSHNSRFSPESTDSSPTPVFLNDYSFALSSDFSKGVHEQEMVNEDENYESPMKEIERLLKHNQLREISAMQVFVDLLLNDYSSNRALYDAYQQLPRPGVAHLPKGIVRLFLQRMSTPWTLSEKSMLRYLSLIDDMQAAKLPITAAEWSSAIYLAGRSFARVTQSDLAHAFSIWKQMEHEAGVQSANVTFNILFDIAVRAGRFALGETILKEMHQRNLRLNRLGRVSLMYYHGLKGDGDGVRKVYRDFVEAGEIVDTLVLNCVIASLINAQEPTAAEQIYQRMKDMQMRIQNGNVDPDDTAAFRRYPHLSDNRLDNEMASNRLSRVLSQAPHLREILPGHHAQLQDVMPLTPDTLTFRPMLAYHASTSGDLDKMAVLLNDMIEHFNLPITTIVFQLLFKGFAIHGPRGGPSTIWTKQRLDTVWNACRNAIKASQRSNRQPSEELVLPSMREINSLDTISSPSSVASDDSFKSLEVPPAAATSKARKKLSPWELLVIDLAAFPGERLKRIQRFHSSQFDGDEHAEPHDEPSKAYADPFGTSSLSPSESEPFRNSFFQQTHYDAPVEKWDHEEGEYVLPSPTRSRLVDPTGTLADHYEADAQEDETVDGESGDRDNRVRPELELSLRDRPPDVQPTRPLINWLLRAYARNTNSREQVEEIFNSVRKLWRPRDERERQSVLRVLQRCLRDCDRMNGLG